MRVAFTPQAWEDYEFWQKTDRRIVKRLHELIRDIRRSPFEGIGKPEALKHGLAGCWSRRVSEEHRLVYRIEDGAVVLLQMRYHYGR